ncbi:MAG: MurR/RpiR family transcriptional regulator [Clostridia bacterium]|nr:MurR/RpiR family transcriptional regulator [Clostridia bacterium]
MGKTTVNIKVLYDAMGKAEKKIADFLLKDPKAILPLSIVDFAEACGVGEATIVRFSKRLGLDGYQQLKISLAQEDEGVPVDENIKKGDTAFSIFSKVCNDITSSLEKTKVVLNEEAIGAFCNAVMKAKEVSVFGLGNSAPVALDATHKFLRLGIRAHAYTDNHMQAIIASHLGKGDLALAISHSGSSRDIVEAMRIAKASGAVTVAITNNGKAPIDEYCDIVLHTISDETNYRILGLSSRIAQLAIVDATYSYLVCHFKGARENIKKTEIALQEKKY